MRTMPDWLATLCLLLFAGMLVAYPDFMVSAWRGVRTALCDEIALFACPGRGDSCPLMLGHAC